jgi:arylsulfatase A-like enzyme
MNIRLVAILFLIFSAANIVALADERTKAEKNKYNVLFIAVDDLRTELGCYGVPYAQTPNLDQLARSSVLFTNHFVQVPTCGASRYALLTGRSPASSGVRASNAALYQGHAALKQKQLASAQSMPELFRRSGYHTVCIGKISHTADGKVYAYNGTGDGRDEVPHAWDELATPYDSWKRGWGVFFAYAGGRHREDGNGNKDLYEFVAEKDDDLPDGLMAAQAIKTLKQMKANNKRFFLGLGFFKPHLPFVATKKDWEAINKIDVPAPKFAEKYASPYWHNSGEFYKYKAPHKKTRPLAKADQVKMRKAYLACVRYVDRQIGRVLQSLDEMGLAENTIVIVWGDHGWHLGESAVWGKHTPWERALNSTLLIRAPGISKAGLKADTLVESVDIYPTLVELCQTKFTQTSHKLDGKSLHGVLAGELSEHRDAAISYWRKAISVRTKTHRLIVTANKSEFTNIELFDIQDNPDPQENLKDLKPDLVKQIMATMSQRHSANPK